MLDSFLEQITVTGTVTVTWTPKSLGTRWTNLAVMKRAQIEGHFNKALTGLNWPTFWMSSSIQQTMVAAYRHHQNRRIEQETKSIGPQGSREILDGRMNRKRRFEDCGKPAYRCSTADTAGPTKMVLLIRRGNRSLPLQSSHRQRRQPTRMRYIYGVLLWILTSSRTAVAEPFRLCLERLESADKDGNNELSEEEFRSAILYLSGGQEPGTALASVLANGVSFVSDTRDAGLQELCTDIHEGILEDATHDMDIEISRCLFAMAIGDTDRNSAMKREKEYPRYANQVSGNQFGFSTPFEEIPKTVQDVFDDFRDPTTDTIDITGAKSTETLNSDGEKVLLNFCQHTAIAILAASSLDDPEKNPIVPEPSEPISSVEPPGGATADDAYEPSFSFAICTRMMVFSDLSRDSFLDQDEYLRFVNRLASPPFSDLPPSLIDVFSTLASDGLINIDGSQPGQDASLFEETLSPICRLTDNGIKQARSNTAPSLEPEPEPAEEEDQDQSYEPSFTFAMCTRMMVFSDTSRDDSLDDEEYFTFVNRLSGNAYTGGFSNLPDTLQATFGSLSTGGLVDIAGSKPGQDLTANEDVLTNICMETDKAIQAGSSKPTEPGPAPGPSPDDFQSSFNFSTCTRMMAFSDTSRDDSLDDAEYFTFVNRLSGNAYSGDFANLPDVLQAAFGSLSTGGLVDITGSKPGQDLTANEDVLTNICMETDKAIQAGRSNPTEPKPSPGPSPLTDYFQSSFTFSTCTRMMAFSDVSRNGSLDAAEYFRFVNRLAAEPFQGNFDALPTSIQNSFLELSIDNSIDISGSRPGENAEDNREELERICTLTDMAIQMVGSNEENPVGEETPAPTNSPDRSIEYNKCLRDMVISDNTRDEKLDQKEYVRFISRNDDRYDATTDFSALSISLQANFESLAGPDNLIDVAGSRPGQDIDVDTEENLRKICRATGEALAVRGPTAAPTGLVSGDTKVLNAFVVSNLIGLRAAGLSYILDDLEMAYDALVREALVNYTNNDSFLEETEAGRHRTLVITNIRFRPTIDSLRDIFCPEFAISSNELCTAAFGSFGIQFENEVSATKVAGSLSTYIQDRIDPFLLNELSAINPNITVNIEGPFSPVDPSQFDFPNFSDGPKEDWSSGVSVGQTVAGSVVLLLVIGTAVYCFKSQKFGSKLFKSKNKLEGIGSDQRRNGSDADQMESGSRYDKSNTNSGDDGSDSDGNEDDESVSFSVQDEETAQRDKTGGDNIFNVFQLGKKKTSNSADDINILENGTNGGLEEDFGDYGFDEPTELQSKGNRPSTFSSTWGENESNDWGGDEWNGGPNDEFGGPTKDSDSDDDDSISPDEASSRDDNISKSSGGSGQIGQFEGMVDNGDWSDVMKATKFGGKFDASFTSRRSRDEPSFSDSSGGSSQSSPTPIDPEPVELKKETPTSMSSEEKRRQSEFRRKVEELVKRAAPEELDNVPSMMQKFAGREDELLTTLQTMYSRSSSNRNFKGVHKSRGIRERDSRVTNNGNAEGSAVIAAASMINSDNPADFGDDSSYSDDRSGSHSGSHSGSRSYTGDRSFPDDKSFSGSRSGSRSRSYHSRRSDEEYGNGSFTGSRSRSFSQGSRSRGSGDGSFSQRSGSYSGSPSGSYRSGSYSRSPSGSYRSGSYRSDEGSYRSGEGSYRSGEGSYRSGEGSYRSGEGSYRSRESGSYRSGEGSHRSGSYRSGTYRSGEGSYLSGEGSYRSGEGSYRSGEGSYRSGEGSYRSGEGSYRSGSGSNRSGEGSYHSGSYRSGDGSFDSRRSGSYSRSPSGSYDSRGSRSRSPSGSYDSRSPTGSYQSHSKEDDTDYGYG